LELGGKSEEPECAGDGPQIETKKTKGGINGKRGKRNILLTNTRTKKQREVLEGAMVLTPAHAQDNKKNAIIERTKGGKGMNKKG